MISEYCIKCMMSELAIKRPVFHSEADFQHELAWLFHTKYGDEYNIRLEKPEIISSDHIAVDIVLLNKQSNFSIYVELKYKTAQLNYVYNYERFDLANQAAQNNVCYDFCKDIQRVENLTYNNASYGFSLFLTNDMSYLNAPRDDAEYRNFSIYQGRNLTGTLDWITQRGTEANRSTSIVLRNSYDLNWEIFSSLLATQNPNFKYLLVSIV